MEIWFVFSCFIFCYLIYRYFAIKSAFKFWKNRGIAYMEPTFFFGNLMDYCLSRIPQLEVYDNAYKNFPNEKYLGFFHFHNPVFIPKDLEIIKHVLVKDFRFFHDRDDFANSSKYEILHSITFLKGSKWRAMRSKLTPAFTTGKIKMMQPMLSDVCDEMVKYIDASLLKTSNLELKGLMSNVLTDGITICAFGLKTKSIWGENNLFKRIADYVFRPSYFLFFAMLVVEYWPNLAKKLNVRVVKEKEEKYFVDCIKTAMEYREQNKITRPDFLQMLLQLKNQGKISEEIDKTSNEESNDCADGEDIVFTPTVLTAQALVFVVAGLESSSSTISMCLYCLALHQDIQDRLRNEISNNLTKHGGITYESVTSINYLNMVIEETLRLYPVLHILTREVTSPYKLPDSDIILPEGMKVRIPLFSLQRDPKYYPDPLKFDPERFSEENRSNIPQYSYMPFGEGPRICIGMRFAYLQMKLILIRLLTNYNFDVCNLTKVPMEFNKLTVLTLQPNSGVWLKISKLNK